MMTPMVTIFRYTGHWFLKLLVRIPLVTRPFWVLRYFTSILSELTNGFLGRHIRWALVLCKCHSGSKDVCVCKYTPPNRSSMKHVIKAELIDTICIIASMSGGTLTFKRLFPFIL